MGCIIEMEEAPENGKESSHSARDNGMNECIWSWDWTPWL